MIELKNLDVALPTVNTGMLYQIVAKPLAFVGTLPFLSVPNLTVGTPIYSFLPPPCAVPRLNNLGTVERAVPSTYVR